MRAFLASAVAVVLFGTWMVLAGRGAPALWVPIIAIALVSFAMDANVGRDPSGGRRTHVHHDV
ncbi:MAG TPA: hypothetical protein VFA84_14170 [Acidimicrobiales bacterium]|nr:hypothetical protein [Acidimicrobiales bacterium]